MIVEAVSWPVATIAGGSALKRLAKISGEGVGQRRADHRELRPDRAAEAGEDARADHDGRAGDAEQDARNLVPARVSRREVTALAMRIVQNGVVALSTEASPAPIAVWPAKISEKGMTLFRTASRKKLAAIGSARRKDGPRDCEIDMQGSRGDRHAEQHQRQRMDFGNGDAGEEERAAPDRAEQQKLRPV